MTTCSEFPPYPQNKKAVVVFSIDDCHPAASKDGYEAGGDLDQGALGHLDRLLKKHPQLQCTLFITADWREKSVAPTRQFLSRMPWIREHLVLADRWPKGKMRLDLHPYFLRCLKSIPRLEFSAHGLDHVGKGVEVVREFLRRDALDCRRRLHEVEKIFDSAGLGKPKGFAPPGWALTQALLRELDKIGYSYVCSARDLITDFHLQAKSNGSGIQGIALFMPEYLEGTRLLHISANWSANSDLQRADQIIQGGGILSIKVHMAKHFFGHTSLDGLDQVYADYLDRLFSHLEKAYGNDLWWASMEQVADWYRKSKVMTQESLARG